jgi:predicted NBD/HSP70 family sugar kinase
MAYAALGTADDSPWTVELDTPTGPGAAQAWEKSVRESLEKIAPQRGGDVWGVLLCVPGIVDESAGKVLFSPNIHWSEGIDFRAMLRGITNVPVEMVQEIRSLALGQLATSPAQRDFLLVDFGHGVGGAAVVGGTLYPGTLPLVGELGHTPVLENDRPCGCGSIGCMETLLSRRGLFASVIEHDAAHGNAVAKYSWTIVEEHVRRHGLEAWLKRSLKAGAASIAGAMNVLGVGRVVITGSLSDLTQEVRAFFADEIRKGAMWAKFGDLAIEFQPRRRTRGLISVGIDRLVVGYER